MRTSAGLIAGRAGAIKREELLAQPAKKQTANRATAEIHFMLCFYVSRTTSGCRKENPNLATSAAEMTPRSLAGK